MITKLGALEEINPAIVEGMFACDLNYLHKFYRQINELEDDLEEDVNNKREINQLEEQEDRDLVISQI